MKTKYFYIRRFLELVKVILAVFWLVLKIVEALRWLFDSKRDSNVFNRPWSGLIISDCDYKESNLRERSTNSFTEKALLPANDTVEVPNLSACKKCVRLRQ